MLSHSCVFRRSQNFTSCYGVRMPPTVPLRPPRGRRRPREDTHGPACSDTPRLASNTHPLRWRRPPGADAPSSRRGRAALVIPRSRIHRPAAGPGARAARARSPAWNTLLVLTVTAGPHAEGPLACWRGGARPPPLRRPTTSATSVSTAASRTSPIGAGITGCWHQTFPPTDPRWGVWVALIPGAGPRLGLPRGGAGSARSCHYFPVSGWGNFRACCLS